ncbi:MAG: hypothetical protein AB1601_06615 [Planctomycetota bacterium]
MTWTSSRGRRLGAAAVVTCLLLTGCFSMPWTRTGNQGGGTLLTATTKLANDDLGGVTPDEIQLLTDVAIQITGVQVPPVTDEQAAAVVTFLADNNITTVASLQDFVRRAEEDPSSVVISDEVLAALRSIIDNLDQYRDAINQGLGDIGLGI